MDSRDDRFTLWRQDDNGNVAEVATFTSLADAEAAKEEYERRGHKQLYWVKRSNESETHHPR
jgi:hypothetical protein